MSSYLWWVAHQLAKQASGWVATHPGESAIIGAAIANPATRGFALDVLRVVGRESLRSTVNVSRGVATSAVTRSTKLNWVWSKVKGAGRFIARHPIATVVLADVAASSSAIALAQHQDPMTASAQTISVAHGISGSGAGGGASQPSIGRGGDWLLGGGSFW